MIYKENCFHYSFLLNVKVRYGGDGISNTHELSNLNVASSHYLDRLVLPYECQPIIGIHFHSRAQAMET